MTLVFEQTVDEVETIVHRLLSSLTTVSVPKDREIEAAKARARSQARFEKPAKVLVEGA